MNLFATTLLRGAWRLAKVIAATAISTAGAHMLIIPMFIEPAINFASRTPSKILYGMIASCFGVLIITLISNIVCYDGAEINGNLDWNVWTVLSILFSGVAIFATRQETDSVPSMALSVNPARAGMIRRLADEEPAPRGKPRASGDDPAAVTDVQWSPK